MPVQRITMFKIKDDANVQKMIDQYKIVADTNQKVHIASMIGQVEAHGKSGWQAVYPLLRSDQDYG